MKNLIFINLVVIVLLTASACNGDRISGNGIITTEERSVNNFTGVMVEGSTDVTVTKGANFKVQVTGYSNLMPYFETKVVNGNLVLGFKEHVNVRHDNTEVTVTLPVLNNLSTYGSGNITSTGAFTATDDFQTSVSGSGNIKIEQGSAKNMSATISGSGNISAFGFSTEKAKVNVAGSGNASVTATDNLTVKIAGSGNVYYKGSPSISVNISGSGAVVKK